MFKNPLFEFRLQKVATTGDTLNILNPLGSKSGYNRGHAQYIKSSWLMLNQNGFKIGEMLKMFNMFNPEGKPGEGLKMEGSPQD